MRFGIFVPQGWRHDLVGIDPADHWSGDARPRRPRRRAPTPPWESIWVYDHFHTVPVPSAHRGDARGVDAHGGVRRVDLARAPRPDVHVHGLPQPRLPREGRRDRRHRLGRPPRDGHRRRLVRARVARLRLRLPRRSPSGSDACARASRSCTRRGRPVSATLDGKYYQVDGAIVQPQPLQPGGIPIWVAGGGEKVTLKIAAKYAVVHELRRHRPRSSRHKSEVLRGHCERARTRLRRRSCAAPNFNTVIGTDEADVARRLERHRGAGRALPRPRGDRAVHARTTTAPSAHARRHARPGDRRCSTSAASSARLRDPLLPRGARTTARARALEARGHAGAALTASRSGARRSRTRADLASHGDAVGRMTACRGSGRGAVTPASSTRRASRQSSASVGSVKCVPSGKTTTGMLGAAADRLGAVGAVDDDLEVDVVVVDAAAVEQRLRTAAVAAPGGAVHRDAGRVQVGDRRGGVMPITYVGTLCGIPSLGSAGGRLGRMRFETTMTPVGRTTPASRCRPR